MWKKGKAQVELWIVSKMSKRGDKVNKQGGWVDMSWVYDDS